MKKQRSKFTTEVVSSVEDRARHYADAYEESSISDTQTTVLPTDAQARKNIPIYSGVFNYFPDALAAIAKVSKEGNDQHHPDEPLHWDKSKSGDHLDAMMRHMLERDWEKVAWRALAHLQTEIESNP